MSLILSIPANLKQSLMIIFSLLSSLKGRKQAYKATLSLFE
jgi:hypothetical protein